MHYEIEGTSVRLAGSMHLIPAASPNLPEWVWRAYEWAEDVVFEADLAKLKDHIYLPNGDSLERRLPVPLWEALKAAWPAAHPLGQVGSLKLWMVILSLPTTRVPAAPGVELLLTPRAHQDKKPIAYLETMAEFAELGDGIPHATCKDALSITLAELPNAPRNASDLHRAWLTGRIDEIEAVIARGPLARMPQIASRVLDSRNDRWLQRILAATTSLRRTLITAGALHLPGQNGLLALVQRAGYSVRLVS
jgi:uncharacterized protein YbaP (TraB family)